MYVKFENGTQFDLLSMKGGDVYYDGHKRDALTAKVSGEYAAVVAAFESGQSWVQGYTDHVATGRQKTDESGGYVFDVNGHPVPEMVAQEVESDRSIYKLVVETVDHRDGTCTVKVARENTLEENYADLQTTAKALESTNATQAAQVEILSAQNSEQADIINILSGGAV